MGGSLIATEMSYYRDSTQQVMRWLLPADQWSLSMATGCRPISPMVIAIIGVASQPFVYTASIFTRCPEKYLPRERKYMDWINTSSHLFTRPHVYKLVARLYPEIAHLYSCEPTDGPDNTLEYHQVKFLMRDPDQPQPIKNYLLASLLEDSDNTDVLVHCAHQARVYSEEFYQRALDTFTRKRKRDNRYDLRHINLRHINEDISLCRVRCRAEFNFTGAWRFLVTCRCTGHSVDQRANIYINPNHPGRLKISRVTLKIAARIYHRGNLEACAGGLRVDIVPQ